jgi:hypothetical protein
MPCTINASVSSTGLVHSADATGNLALQGNDITGLTVNNSGKVVIANTALSTASAGTLEYDGGELYFTPLGTQRGLIPGMQYYRLNGSLAGSNVNTAQSFFGVGVTLSSSTIYKFEYTIAMSKTAGVTSHNVALLFGGTATINNIGYFTQIKYNTTGFGSVSSTDSWSVWSATAGSTGIFTGITSATEYHVYFCTGTVSINSGGTFIPQYILSAAPGGAYTVQAGSDFLIYPVGSAGSNTSVGTWA